MPNKSKTAKGGKKKKTLLSRVNCFLGHHEIEIFGTKKVRSLFFGGIVDSHLWECVYCSKSYGWTCSETLF